MSNKLISYCFVSSFSRDADEVLIYRDAKILKENGYKVTYIVNDKKGIEFINGVEVQSTGIEQGGYLKRIFLLPFLISRKLLRLNYDVYQFFSLEYIIVGVFLKLFGKKKIIFQLRESHPYTLYQQKSLPMIVKKVLVTIMSIWMRYTLRYFDVVITVADDILENLKKWGIKKCYLIGNFPNVNKNYKLTLEDYMHRENCLLYYGTIYTISCQDEVLNALSSIGNVSYLLAGRFRNNEEYHENLMQNSGWKYVNFKNGFKPSEILSFFNRATISNVIRDFSKLQSKNGSLGIIKIFESMEAALPIICTDVPVYREIMKKYKCGILVDPKDVKQIKDAIVYLRDHKEEAWQMGQEGRRAVIEEYSWDIQSQKYISIINNLYN